MTSEALLRMTKFSARTLADADLDEHSDLLDDLIAAVRATKPDGAALHTKPTHAASKHDGSTPMTSQPRGITLDDLNNRFAFHPPTVETFPQHAEVRRQCFVLAEWLVNALPPGRETSLAVTAIEEAMMWSIAAIARN